MRACKTVILSVACLALISNAPSKGRGNACSLARADHRNDLVHVPFREIDGRIYVDVRVNGNGPYVFALDTGASGMGRADNRLVVAQALPSGEVARTSDGVQESQVKTVRIESLSLGRLVRKDLEVIARDYRRRSAPEAAFAGILGRDFFSDGLLAIDYGERTVSFSRRDHLTSSMGGALPYSKAFRVPVTIGGIETSGNIDTGANVTLVVPLDFYSRLSAEPLRDVVAGTLTNSQISTNRATINGQVRIGGLVADNVEARVSAQFPEVLVGAHLLRNTVLLIDQRSQTIALCPKR